MAQSGWCIKLTSFLNFDAKLQVKSIGVHNFRVIFTAFKAH